MDPQFEVLLCINVPYLLYMLITRDLVDKNKLIAQNTIINCFSATNWEVKKLFVRKVCMRLTLLSTFSTQQTDDNLHYGSILMLNLDIL